MDVDICGEDKNAILLNKCMEKKINLKKRVFSSKLLKQKRKICRNGSSDLADLREYRRLKDLRKGPISRIDLRKMIMKFEEAGNLGVLPGRGQKTGLELKLGRKSLLLWLKEPPVLHLFFSKWLISVMRVGNSVAGSHKRCSATSPLYGKLLQQQIIPALQEQQCLQTTIFTRDGATPHVGRRVKALISANFGDNSVISRHFSDAWPPRSPYLNPCDFWLWGFLNDSVYSRGIRDLPDLKNSIIRHVAEIPCELLRATIENAIMRFQHVIDVNGTHIEHIL
ncbi:uncharacterized protein TNCV_4342891 [Trichonephila clavipes]|nr:uncharacterized protein TNCV_4342891 [Trichonephila clavipes]